MRYTGHLDLHHTWERTLRRARLPLAYSQGFNPHPRINLASALPLGFTSEGEIIDIWLEQPVSEAEIKAALDQAAPPGLQVTAVQEMHARAPTLQVELEASEFYVTFLDPIPNLEGRLVELLAAENLLRQRRGKEYDLRPLVQRLECLPDGESDRQRILICLTAKEGATGRPEEVIAALGAAPERTRVHRTRLIFKGQSAWGHEP